MPSNHSVPPRRQYPHAPITEGLIDFRVSLPAETNVESLNNLTQSLSESYPTSKKAFSGSAMLEVDLEAQRQHATGDFQHRGYRLETEQSDPYVVNATLDGLTVSRLRPYNSWEQLRDEAQRVWELYSAAVRPDFISRIAVRYINRIDIPLAPIGPQILRMEDYFALYPEVPETLPEPAMEGYLIQVRMPQRDIESNLTINSAIAQPPRPGIMSILLDLDLWSEGKEWQAADAWQLLEVFHVRKNVVFETCIKDKARRLFA